MKDAIKQKVMFTLKYSIGFALLFWLLARIDRQQMLHTLLNLTPKIILLVLALSLTNLFIQYRRWKFLVEQQSSDYNKGDLIPSFFAGFTFRLLLPGGHAEISKVFLLPGRKSGKVMAFAIEKFFQTYVKFVLVLIGLPFLFPQFKWVFVGILLATIGSYPFLPQILKARLLRRFQEKKVNYHRLFFHATMYSLGVFICLILQYYLLLNDAWDLPFNTTLLSVIYIWGSGLVPVSVSGLGVRENVAVFVLQKYGIPPATAVGISLSIFTINVIIPALIGLIFIYRRQHHFKEAKETLKNVSSKLIKKGKDRLFENGGN